MCGVEGVLNLFNVHSNIYWRAAKALHRTLPRFIGCLRGSATRPALGNYSWLPRNGSEASCIPVCNRCGPLEKFKAVLQAEYVESKLLPWICPAVHGMDWPAAGVGFGSDAASWGWSSLPKEIIADQKFVH